MRTRESYEAELAAALPQGFAWTRDEDSVTTMLVVAMAFALWTGEKRLWDLIAEINPTTATELLNEFEVWLGLPDNCISYPNSTLQERRRAVATKLNMRGGASRKYFIRLAKLLLDQDITITEFLPFRAGHSCAGDALTNDVWDHVWQVNLPGEPPPIFFRAGESAAGDPLLVISADPSWVYFRSGEGHAGDPLLHWLQSPLECLFRRIKPAHTQVIFERGGIANAANF